MRTIGNILWFILAGVWLAIGYVIAGVLLCITIIGIPFGKASFRIARVALWPFGRTVVPNPNRAPGFSMVGNILWFILAGWWLMLIHLASAILLAMTIIGIPFAVQSIKLAALSINPLGKMIVTNDEAAAAIQQQRAPAP
jgi:uncharacterized membrane protein YccF (DUF307 family)